MTRENVFKMLAIAVSVSTFTASCTQQKSINEPKVSVEVLNPFSDLAGIDWTKPSFKNKMIFDEIERKQGLRNCLKETETLKEKTHDKTFGLVIRNSILNNL